VVSVSAQLGARASAGGELVRVADERDLEARLAVAESDARAVLPGQSVVLTTAAGSARGTVARIDPAAVNGTVQVAVAMTRLPAGVRTDESVQGQIELERIADTIWVTRPAGVADDTTATLYRLTGSDRAVRVRVVFGRGSADRIAVRSGLRPGQTVIISDMSVAGDHADVTLE
jgi:HlyD family secretion protein